HDGASSFDGRAASGEAVGCVSTVDGASTATAERPLPCAVDCSSPAEGAGRASATAASRFDSCFQFRSAIAPIATSIAAATTLPSALATNAPLPAIAPLATIGFALGASGS